MPNPSLFDTPIDNRGLFSDHYLVERFPEWEEARALHENADAAFLQVQDLYFKYASEVESWNENQTEDYFVQPVLDILRWERRVQTWTQRQGRVGRPDYALFSTEDRRKHGVELAKEDEAKIYQYADAVADAKYWGRPLDGPAPDPAREDSAAMRRNNPSFQIIDYVTITGVQWGFLTNGALWRLYYEKAPSRLETYLEINLEHLCHLTRGSNGDKLRARNVFRLFYSLFRAEAYRPLFDGKSFVDVVYEASDTYAGELEDALKMRVFDHVFLELATGLYTDHVRRGGGSDTPSLNLIYRATLILLYRLLFLLYAEARGLLPVRNEDYYPHSITAIAKRAQKELKSGRTLSDRHADLWNDLKSLFRTVDEGDPAFGVPAYNGGLFRDVDDANRLLAKRDIGQKYLVNALVNLTALDPEIDPTGPSVDYKSLDVRQLGSIYEGLLEHRLVISEGKLDLLTDKGERRASGSYYTPHFVVEYIVETTLAPVVEERIQLFESLMAQIQEMSGKEGVDDAVLQNLKAEAQDAFLTIRVCDPAMGSGHFLVYAADYLAERFGQIIGRYPESNPVTERLEEIREEIVADLQRQGVDIVDENLLRDTSLLKRLVMKRCIYGVDLNPMTVELAKLSLWLHSFTVGAPLSFLNHHLKPGNSLIGTTVEAVLEETKADLFGNLREEILIATKFLHDAAFSTDATIKDVRESAEAFAKYETQMKPYKKLLNVWLSEAFGNERGQAIVRDYRREIVDGYQKMLPSFEDEKQRVIESAERLSVEKHFFHWQLEFPEVFYRLDPPGEREDAGFDAVIGNPPYVNIKEQDQNEAKYYRSQIPGTYGRADLAIVFALRMFELVKENTGRLSFIMTNKFLKAKYGGPFMNRISENGTIEELIDLTDSPIFEDPKTYPAIVRILRQPDGEDGASFEAVREIRVDTRGQVERALYDGASTTGSRWVDFSALGVPIQPLGDLCQWIREGSANGKDDVFIFRKENESGVEESLLKPFAFPEDLGRYAGLT